MSKVVTKQQAAELIKDGDTVVLCSNGGGVLEPYVTLEAIEKRFIETGSPSNITLLHSSGIGNKKEAGITRFAHKGMVKRVIGGHWGWSPEMQAAAFNGEIEAYNFPQGVMCQLYREIAAHRPGLITKTGMYTYVDPRMSGGKLNDNTKEELVELINLNNEDWLFYKSFPIDVAIVRGTVADTDGNISMEQEAAQLDVLEAAQAAHNSGGIVIAQVKYLAQAGTIDSKKVKIPGVYVDAVVVDPNQMQTFEGEYNPAFSGDVKVPLEELPPFELSERKVIARRAFMEIDEGTVINLGFGMPDGVARVAAEEGFSDKITMTIEQGIYGGVPAAGDIFGVASNPIAMVGAATQFDFYSGHGLDTTCLGLAQVDAKGNVNVSKFGSTIAGCGGFIDISQSAKKVVLCGTFTAKGFRAEIKDGKLNILQEGKIKKFINNVEHITFSAQFAKESEQKVVYVTERAVFELRDGKLTLTEIAPGVELEKDVLNNMDFLPEIADDLKTMDAILFQEDLLNIK